MLRLRCAAAIILTAQALTRLRRGPCPVSFTADNIGKPLDKVGVRPDAIGPVITGNPLLLADMTIFDIKFYECFDMLLREGMRINDQGHTFFCGAVDFLFRRWADPFFRADAGLIGHIPVKAVYV